MRTDRVFYRRLPLVGWDAPVSVNSPYGQKCRNSDSHRARKVNTLAGNQRTCASAVALHDELLLTKFEAYRGRYLVGGIWSQKHFRTMHRALGPF